MASLALRIGVGQCPPRVERTRRAVRFARLIHRPGRDSWRTYGPRRTAASQAGAGATQRDAARPPRTSEHPARALTWDRPWVPWSATCSVHRWPSGRRKALGGCRSSQPACREHDPRGSGSGSQQLEPVHPIGGMERGRGALRVRSGAAFQPASGEEAGHMSRRAPSSTAVGWITFAGIVMIISGGSRSCKGWGC